MAVSVGVCTGMVSLVLVLGTIVPSARAVVYFEETFQSDNLDEWIVSTATKGDNKYDGQWKIQTVDNATETTPENLALVTQEANKHYCLSAPLAVEPDLTKPLIVQYSVRYLEPMLCGGSYLKLLVPTDDLQLANVKDDSLYSILFGPDKCGGDFHLRFIFNFKNPKTNTYREVHANGIPNVQQLLFSDKKSHLVTLVLQPDNTFQILVDEAQVLAGRLGSVSDFSSNTLIPPKTIDDPEDRKPDDWVDDKEIDDPKDHKPEDWVEDAQIVDPTAEQPVDWDEDMDGEWEAPMIANPLYRGVWKAKRIENPEYKGIWRPKQLDNPEHFTESDPFSKLLPFSAVSFELWTITAGTAFDNIIITDSMDEAKASAVVWRAQRDVQDNNEGSGSFIVDTWNTVSKATQQNPWLWGVYALMLFVPIYFLFYAGSSASSPSPTTGGKPKGSSATSKSNSKIEEVNDNDEDDDNENDADDDDKSNGNEKRE